MSVNPFADIAAEVESQKIGGEERDSLGGQNLLKTAAYEVVVTNFFQSAYESGAKYVVVEGKTSDGKPWKFQEVVTNKAGSATYEKDGEKFFLPGYNKMNSIALLATGKEMSKLAWETKQVKIYNKAAGGEVPTPVPVAVDMIGKKLILGILEQTVNQTQKNDATGKYEPIHAGDNVPLTKDENVIDKVFHAESKKTVPEFRAKSETAQFYNEWIAKYGEGKKLNKVKDKGLVLKKGSTGGGNNTNAAGGQTLPPEDNLFG